MHATMFDFDDNHKKTNRLLAILKYGEIFLEEYIEKKHPLVAFQKAEMFAKDFSEKEKIRAHNIAYDKLLSYVETPAFVPESDEEIKFNAIAFLLKLEVDKKENLLNVLKRKHHTLNNIVASTPTEPQNSSVANFHQKSKTTLTSSTLSNGLNLMKPVLGPSILGINLQKDEHVYFIDTSAKLIKKQKVTTRIDYAGITFRLNLTDNLKYRSGSINPKRTIEEKFIVEDTGKFYITDRKLGFIGFKTFTINLNKIVRVSMDYANNYVLIYKENREKPYIIQSINNNEILELL